MNSEKNIDGRLTEKRHWDSIYDNCNHVEYPNEWMPDSYLSKLIDEMLSEVIEKKQPKTLLEMGCGNSAWLPYLSKKYGIEVYGVDYSERGCELVRQKLGTNNNIFCFDFLDPRMIESVPKVDMIISLGVVEHFTDASEVLEIFKKLLNPDGVLFTEVPYILSSTGKLCKFYQPTLYNKHVAHTKESLVEAYNKIGLSCEKCDIVGHFSLDMLAWGVDLRFKHCDSIVQFILKQIYRNKKTQDGVFLYLYGSYVQKNA